VAEIRRKWLVESIVLAGLLVAVAFLAILGEPRHADLATSIILVVGYGIPWLVAVAGLFKGPIYPTPLLIGAWCVHFVLLVFLFYRAQVVFDRWKSRRGKASA
jgi:hypothetical protein